jgi:hypothetical protein
MDIEKFIDELKKIVQSTYFSLNPLNPCNTEDYYQELLKVNLELITKSRVDSEITYQRTTSDLNGEIFKLKNKTERHDLILEMYDILFELKCLSSPIKDECRNQMFSYLDKQKYQYGIIINFMKFNKTRLVAEVEVYQKKNEYENKDMFGNYYARYDYTLIDSFKTEDYNEIIGSYTHEKKI